MNNRAIIVPAAELSLALQGASTYANMRVNSQILTPAQADHMVRLGINDNLNQCLLWASPNQSTLDLYLEEQFDWFIPGASSGPSSEWCRLVLQDPIYYRLSALVSGVIGKTWNIWSVDDRYETVCLVEGEDFRVYDWTRRMASGEWQ